MIGDDYVETSIKDKKLPSFSMPFKYFKDGFMEVMYSLMYVFYYGYIGLKTIFINPFLNIFNASSKRVDKVYKSTKMLMGKKDSTVVVPPIEETKSTQDNTQPNVDKEEVKVDKEEALPQLSFFAKLKDKLNVDLDQFKTKGQLKKLEQEKEALQKELADPNARRNTEPKMYLYTARNKAGRWLTGRFIGFSKMDVNSFLLNEGYEVYKIENNKWIDFMYGESKYSTHRMKNKDLVFWLTQLSTYIKSGITLTDSVKILMNQSGKNKTLQGINQSIAYQLTMGEAFSSALQKQGDVFPSLLINMLKAAEATGELEETLDDMVDYYTEIETNRKEMINAITYPVLVLVFALGVITFILLYVLPEFSKIYSGLDVEIKGLTKFLLNSSGFLKDYIWVIVLVVVIIIAVIVYLYKKVYSIRRAIQETLMRMPLFGSIIIYSEMTIFSKTFSSLLKNNVNITESIGILSKVTENEIYREIMIRTINNISKGEKISEAFKNQWAIPEIAYHMIVTGESTGQLAEMMNRVAHYYQEQHHTLVASLKQFIEPVMIISLAVIVGGIILAVIVPMFDMYNQISLS